MPGFICKFSGDVTKCHFFQGMFKFTDGRQLPPDYRNLKSAGGAVGARKVVSGHYARADSLDKKKLKKYVKALATEAKLNRNARNRD